MHGSAPGNTGHAAQQANLSAVGHPKRRTRRAGSDEMEREYLRRNSGATRGQDWKDYLGSQRLAWTRMARPAHGSISCRGRRNSRILGRLRLVVRARRQVPASWTRRTAAGSWESRPRGTASHVRRCNMCPGGASLHRRVPRHGRMNMEIKTCKRCGEPWCFHGTGRPIRCGKCKSPYWDRERVNEDVGDEGSGQTLEAAG